MNGIEKISEKILADAHDKADAILKEAAEAVAHIESQASARIERDVRAAKTLSDAHVAAIEEQGRRTAVLDRKKLFAAERQKLVIQIFDHALDALIGLPVEQYQALLVSLAVQAAGDGEGGELLLCAHDRAAFGVAVVREANRKLPVAMTLASDTAPIVGGIVLRRGLIEMNAALDVIVHMLSETMALEVSNILFGKGA